jgi:hypothetical protein
MASCDHNPDDGNRDDPRNVSHFNQLTRLTAREGFLLILAAVKALDHIKSEIVELTVNGAFKHKHEYKNWDLLSHFDSDECRNLCLHLHQTDT